MDDSRAPGAYRRCQRLLSDLSTGCPVAISATYNKYMFGRSDDHDIFLMYICYFPTVPGSQLPKSLEFPEQ